MKVGIITFHRAVNYGAVLQAYALCSTIKELGLDCEVIDYRCDFIEDYYDSKKLIYPRNWKRLISYVIYNGNLFPDKERFASFLKEHNVLSEKPYHQNELNELESSYDCFVAGSDQVWNFATAGFDKAYFLDFVSDSKKKKSYAASFGFSEIPENLKEKYRYLLSSFSVLSVREQAGKQIIESLLDRNVNVDLDPTLLVSTSNWRKLSEESNIDVQVSERGYILVYMIGEDKRVLQISKTLGNLKDLDIIYITDRWKNRKEVKNIRGVKVNDWIRLIDRAEYVITNSFHGTAFSVIMNKKFVVVTNKEGQKKSSRIETLLNDMNLVDRFTYSEKEALSILNREVDYLSVNRLLEKRKMQSIDNLRQGFAIEE